MTVATGDEVGFTGDLEAALLVLDNGEALLVGVKALLNGVDILAEALKFRLELVDQGAQGVEGSLLLLKAAVDVVSENA